MGLFNLFKKPIIINDEFFGALRFVDFKDPSKDYFEGKGHFSPTNSKIEYIIQADRNGPNNEQKKFYQDLQTNFDEYISKIKPLIEDEFGNWKEGFSIKNFNMEFIMVCITIPRFDTRPLIWEMAFTTIHDKEHHVTIDFTDFEPNGVLIDG